MSFASDGFDFKSALRPVWSKQDCVSPWLTAIRANIDNAGPTKPKVRHASRIDVSLGYKVATDEEKQFALFMQRSVFVHVIHV